MPPRFAEKVCLVTGGGSGIGRATCELLAADGGRVVALDINVGAAEETAKLIAAAGGQAIGAAGDVSKSADVQAALQRALDAWGRLDVLVNCAATMTFTPLAETSEEDWERVMGVNLRSVFLTCRYALPHMRDGGAIVNVSSVHAHRTSANVVPYATTKGGMEAFTRGLSIELAPRKIRVNAVAPGAVDTPMLWNNPNVKSGAEKITGAVGKPGDIADAICFLAGPQADFITGAVLLADGGRLAQL